MTLKFAWDEEKSRLNRRKHGVSFREASELFSSGVDFLELFDDEQSVTEDRLIAIGPIRRGLVLIVWTERDDDTIRIISARWATADERELYRNYHEDRYDGDA
jgi:uncharacterized DUF497 family protein